MEWITPRVGCSEPNPDLADYKGFVTGKVYELFKTANKHCRKLIGHPDAV